MIKAIIIDDNPDIRETNKKLLAEYFSEVELLGEADSVDSGYDLIRNTNPDLVLLDIELKDGTGFQILQRLKQYSFKVIFITAYDKYALKAIKFHAIDYILKPVNVTEFRLAVQSTLDVIEKDLPTTEQSNQFLTSFNSNCGLTKIMLRTLNTMHLVNISDILFCKNDNSYTTFYLISDEKIMVSKGIAFYEEILTDSGFYRPHQSFLVNLNHVKKLDKTDGGFVILDSGKEIPVSTRRKKGLIQILENL
ncbi:MAG: LytTR family DNA-binding domain-containing protein [Bacteroidales bacterium]|nr:LytTR family DNA-binding domain-containing protein [Bacteroidales bacterium]MCF8389920.1 LytTR family DNA-binding domain-containing protein [Bacteroidales bacterium]